MTYSIVARDPETGRLGVAVQSCVLAVGTRVPFVRAGVGAVAVQAASELWYGRAALDLLERGATAPRAMAALQGLIDADDVQIGLLDAEGRASAWTGLACTREAGDLVGDGVSVQANCMARDRAWPAMLEAFDATDGELADRFLAALRAAEEEGGDIRGAESAAILVVSPDRDEAIDYHSPDGPTIDLRVDDHDDPVAELRRLLDVKRAHDHLVRAFDVVEEDWEETVSELDRGLDLAPEDRLLSYFRRLADLLDSGDDARAGLLEEAMSADPWFAERVRRTAEAETIRHPGLAWVVEALDP